MVSKEILTQYELGSDFKNKNATLLRKKKKTQFC